MVERVLSMHEVVGSIPTSSSARFKFSFRSSAFRAPDGALGVRRCGKGRQVEDLDSEL